MSFTYSYYYEWDERKPRPNGSSGSGSPLDPSRSAPPPPSKRTPTSLTNWWGFNLAPDAFQDYLLDIVTLAGIRAPVGHTNSVDESPVGNWLRILNLRLAFTEGKTLADDRYTIVDAHGTTLGRLPRYLVRFLELLALDTANEPEDYLVPAYQALALLNYVVTTDRYRGWL